MDCRRVAVTAIASTEMPCFRFQGTVCRQLPDADAAGWVASSRDECVIVLLAQCNAIRARTNGGGRDQPARRQGSSNKTNIMQMMQSVPLRW